jgi:hypothetical protein
MEYTYQVTLQFFSEGELIRTRKRIMTAEAEDDICADRQIHSDLVFMYREAHKNGLDLKCKVERDDRVIFEWK